MKDKKLGRGLEFLLGDATPVAAQEDVIQVDLSKVIPNPYQPRHEFEPAEIDALAHSIQRDGLLQPVVVRKRDQGFELVAGERRVRACRSLGWASVRATVVDLSDSDMLQVALAENIVRRDLNPIDRARAFSRLQEEFKLTQEEIGARLGMDRSTVANLVRLLELPEHVQGHVSRGTLSMGHARALLSVPDREAQRALCDEAIAKGMSVREVERRTQAASKAAKPRKAALPETLVRDLELRIQAALATKVRLQPGKRRGSIIIEYYGNKDLERLVEQIAPKSETP